MKFVSSAGAVALGALLVTAAPIAFAPGCAAPHRSLFSAEYLYGPPDVPPIAYEHYVLGRKASYEERHDDAVAEFRLAAALAPNESELRVAVADELFAANRDDEARSEVNEILARWPKLPGAWRLLGKLRARAQDMPGAEQAFEYAITLEPDSEEAYLLLAGADRQLGKEDAAIGVYRRLVAKIPDSLQGNYRLGRALLARKDYAGAEPFLVRAVGIDGDHVDARIALAETYRATGRAELASQTLRDAFERSGQDPSVGQRLFRQLLANGDRDGAVALLAALDDDGREPAVRLEIGYLYLTVHRADDSLRIARALLDRDPKFHAARLLAARAHAQKKARDEAIKVCLEIPADADEFAEARAFAADQQAAAGRPQKGLELATDALAQLPDNPTLLVAQAVMLEKTGDPAGARKALDAARQKHPDDEDLLYARASLEERQGDADAAVALMKPRLETNPDDVLVLNYVGYSFANRGVHLDEAEKLLRHATELRPDDGYVLDSWGWLLVQLKRYDEADEVLGRADRLAPDEPEILYHLGELHFRRGDSTGARSIFQRALSLDPDDRTRHRLEERLSAPAARVP